MSSFLCGCCQRRSEEVRRADANVVQLSVQLQAGRAVGRLREELDTMCQRKEDERQTQQETVTSSLQQHRHRMEDLKSGHDAEMAEMRQSNRENTTACDSAMVKMKAKNQREMNRNMADHNASMATMRQHNGDVRVKRNERVNVLKSANAQRTRNLEQTVGAQCAGLEQRQHASKIE